jgi:hypothetical protein
MIFSHDTALTIITEFLKMPRKTPSIKLAHLKLTPFERNLFKPVWWIIWRWNCKIMSRRQADNIYWTTKL